MARREKIVTITAEGRDKGKRFHLREMPADQGERWFTRAILAVANGGARLPEGALDLGGAAGFELTWRNVLAMGVTGLQGLRWADLEPLLDEMKPLIQWCPPGNAPPQPIFPGEDSQIEEVATWYKLRYDLIELHMDFSLAGLLSTSGTTPQPSPA